MNIRDANLDIRLLSDGSTARLLAPFEVEGPDGESICVPVDFVTDITSTNWAVRRVIPRYGKYSKASVIHDWLYASGIVSKEKADEIFLFLMDELGVSVWRRRAMYRAVRMFGGRAWRGHRAKDSA